MLNKEVLRTTVDRVFKEETKAVEEKLNTIYNDVKTSLTTYPQESWQYHIQSEEGNHISRLIHDLQFDFKAHILDACSDIIIGKPSNILWAEAVNPIPLPKAITLEFASADDKGLKIGSLPTTKANHHPPVGKWLLLGGICLEIIGWVFVPAKGVWSAIVKGIGVVSIAAGCVRLTREHAQMVKENDDLKALKRQEALKEIGNICEEQKKLNGQNITEWMRQAQNAFIEVCEKEIK